MRRKATLFLLLLSVLLFASACSGAEKKNEDKDKKAQRIDSAELAAVDQRLDEMDQQTTSLRDRVSALQDKVADHVGTDAAKLQTELDGSATYIEIDKNSVLRVNGIAMSRSDFGVYTQRRGKEICKPEPTLVQHIDAEYDLVGFVMDTIYAEGCSSLDIQQVK